MTEIKLCDFGCGLEAVKYFSSTQRWCCSNSPNKCSAKRKKDSEKKKGKNPFEGRVHPRGMKDKKPWNFGKAASPEYKEKISRSLRGKSHPQTEETKKKISETHRKNKKGGGYRERSGIGKRSWYESPIAGKVYLHSSYELRLVQLLDSQGISWRRNMEGYPYFWKGDRKYYPDFIISSDNEEFFLETKGFVSAKDIAKWESFPLDLRVITEKELSDLERGELGIKNAPHWKKLLSNLNCKFHNQI